MNQERHGQAGAISAGHVPVMLEEVLEHLVHTPQGTYVDATFGRGGHTRGILSCLTPAGRVVGIDRDPAAVAFGEALAASDSRFVMLHGRHSELAALLTQAGLAGQAALDGVDGVLIDAGVSSPQLDDPQRGFSFLQDGDLDMRMDPGSGRSAAQWLNEAEQAEIARVLKQHGEERLAGRISRAIVAARPLKTTLQLADVVEQATPAAVRRQSRKHPATRTFQAIRIYVNDEDAELRSVLEQAFAALRQGGRLAVISFHSLEDRVVKQQFRKWTQPPSLPRRVPVRDIERTSLARNIAGPLRAGEAEVATNPRSRSATLRVIEKTQASVS